MKREAVLKVLLVLIIGVALFVRPINVFAAVDLNTEFWEDQGSLEDVQEEEEEEETTTPETTTPSTTTTNTNTTTNTTTTNTTTTTNNSNKDIPEAGLAEDTMMVVSVVALVAIAGFALKKVNDYKNI